MRTALALVPLIWLVAAVPTVTAAPRVAVLGPADRASAETALAALQADPFAEDPLAELERIYQRGPGAQALYADFTARAARPDASATDLIVLGRLALARGRKPDALRALARAGGLCDDPRRLRRLGRMLDENGGRADAIRAYQRGRQDADPIELRGLLVRLGALQLADGKTADARASWNEAKRLSPSDQTLRRQIAEALAAHGAFREALAELQEIEPIVAKEPLALLTVLRREAEFGRRMGDRHFCTTALLRAYGLTTELHSSSLRAEITVELLLLYKPDHSTSAAARRKGLDELLAQARALQRTVPAVEALVGDILAARGDTQPAILALRRAEQAQPGDPYLLRRLCALETGPDRLRDLAALFDAERNDASIGLDLIGARFDAKDPQHAIETARALRTRFPDNSALLIELGRVLSKNGQHAEALVLQERALKLEPDLPEAILAYADELRAAGRTADASSAYLRLVAKDTSVTSYRRLIDLLAQRNLTGDLKRLYADAIAKWPADEALRRDYARWLVANGAQDEGLAQWKLVQDNPKISAFLRDYAKHEIHRLEMQKMLAH